MTAEKPNILNAAMQKVAMVFWEKAEKEAESIPFQGAMLSFLAQEKEDISWHPLIQRVPRGVPGLGSQGNSLSTPDNLARWGSRWTKSPE